MTDTPADPFAKPAGPPPNAPPPYAPPPNAPPPGWAPSGWAPGYGPQAPYGQPGPAPRPERQSPAAAPVLALVGFAVLVTGLFALPLNGYEFPGSGIGYVETREIVDQFEGSRATDFYSTLAQAWWLWGVLVVGAVVVVLLCLAVARVAPVLIGLLIAAVALAGGVVHALAMAQSTDLRSLQRLVRSDNSFFDHPGAGVWVSLIGFGIVLAGGLVVAATGRR